MNQTPWYMQRTFWVILGQTIASLGELVSGGLLTIIGGAHAGLGTALYTTRAGINKALATAILAGILVTGGLSCSWTQPRPSTIAPAIADLSTDSRVLYDELLELRSSGASKEQIDAVAAKLKDVTSRLEALGVTVNEETGEVLLTASGIAGQLGGVAAGIGPMLPPPIGPIVMMVGHIVSALGGVGAHLAQHRSAAPPAA